MNHRRHISSHSLSIFGGKTYQETVQGLHPIGYWPMNEPSGTTVYDRSGNGFNGTYVNTPTLGQDGIGDGLKCPRFTKTSSQYANLLSAGLTAAASGQEGTISLWFKVYDPACWNDGVSQGMLRFQGSYNNSVIDITKHTNTGLLWAAYRANGVWSSNQGIAYLGPTDWTNFVITWSKTGNYGKYYVNGSKFGADWTTIDDWTAALNEFHAGRSGSSYWNGWLAHVAVWNTPLSDAQVKTLAWHNYKGFRGVIFTFDDGSATVIDPYNYMVARGLPGTIYAVTDLIDTTNFLTHAQLATIDAGGWVIGNHTKDHAALTSLTEAQQEAELSAADTALTGWGLSRGNKHVAYPYGGTNANTYIAMAATGMLTGRGALTTEPISISPGGYPYNFNLAWYAGASKTLAEAQAAITEAISRGGWCTLLFHTFVSSGGSSDQWGLDKFYGLIDWLVANGTPVKSVVDFYNDL
jgi:peptidoglycan/xylan/chitin deacetylase (PgdA/CDA1 family)